MEFSECVHAFPPYLDYSDILWFRFSCVAKNFPYEIQFAQTLFSVVFGLGGFSFGVWRAWRYREKLLFDRLQDFLSEEAEEIEDANQDLFTRIIRPSISSPGLTSFDTLWSLTRLRTRRRFVPLLAFAATKTAAQQYLEASAEALERTQKQFSHYHSLALKRALSARLLCSVVDASTAAAAQNDQEKTVHTQLAHEHVTSARHLTDCHHDARAIEIEINLLLAEQRYPEVGTLAGLLINPTRPLFKEDDRSPMERALSVGRAHKYQALDKIASNHPQLAANALSSALSRYRNYPHVRESDLLDFAQIAELRGACSKRLRPGPKHRKYSKLAEICYAKLRDASDPWNRGLVPWLLSKLGGDKYHSYLREAAEAGLERLKKLRNDDDYFPPPFPPRTPTSP